MILEIALALTLRDLGWLAGDWQIVSTAQCVEEQWTAPSTNMLVGMSRTIAGGRTTSFEFMRIEARADGIYYVAQPGGRPPVDFKLSSDSPAELIFLNPGHADRLKRVIYRHEADDRLTARIEGEKGGQPFAEDYQYRRAPGTASSRCGVEK